METIVKKVTGQANGYYGIIARDNTGGMIHCCIQCKTSPKVGDKLKISYHGGRIVSAEFNGLQVL